MFQFIIDMFPSEYASKLPISLKKIASTVAEYFGYSKSERLSLEIFLRENLKIGSKDTVGINALSKLIPQDEMINTFFLRGALNSKFRIKVEEIKSRFLPQEEVMAETAELITRLK